MTLLSKINAMVAIALLGCLLVAVAPGQQPAAPQPSKATGKAHTLHGKVTEVGKDRLTVDHDKIEGYMAAMTMPYKVDHPDVLARVKTGDQIEATVYEDDYTLYDVKVVPPEQEAK